MEDMASSSPNMFDTDMPTTSEYTYVTGMWVESVTEVGVNVTDGAFVTRQGRGAEPITFAHLAPPDIVDLGIGFGHLEGAQLRAALSIMTILEVLVIVCNVLIILAIRHHRQFRTITSLYIVSLAVSDLFCALGMPIGLLAKYIPDIFLHSVYVCILPFCLLMTVLASAILNLLAVSVDRYIALIKPLRYATIMTRKRSIIIIVCAWTLSFLIGFIPLLWHKPKYYEPHTTTGYCEWDRVVTVGYMALYSLVILALPILIIIVLYVQIFRIARTHAKSIDSNRSLSEGLRVNTTALESTSMSVLNTPEISKVKRHSDTGSSLSVSSGRRLTVSLETKVAITISLIVCTFAVCWLPLTIALLLGVFCEDKCGVTAEVRGWLGILTLFNSFFNPIIYTVRTKDFRAAFRELVSKAPCLTKLCACSRSTSDHNHRSTTAAYSVTPRGSKSNISFIGQGNECNHFVSRETYKLTYSENGNIDKSSVIIDLSR